MIEVWAGVDTGKTHHHCVVIEEQGRRLLSRRVANDEPELQVLIADVTALSEQVTWAADMAGGGAALLIGRRTADPEIWPRPEITLVMIPAPDPQRGCVELQSVCEVNYLSPKT